MTRTMRKWLCLLLCATLLLPLTACNGDEGYFMGMRELRAGNYAAAYAHFRASTDTRAPGMLRKFAFVPLTYDQTGANTNYSVVYTYDAAGYPVKRVETVVNKDGTQHVNTTEYRYTDGVKRIENLITTSSYGHNRQVVYNERGDITYNLFTNQDNTMREETYYVYNERGDLLRSDQEYEYNNEGTLYDRSEYTYDDKGRILSMVRHETLYVGSTVTETYTYAADGSYVKNEKRDTAGSGAQDGYEHQIHYDAKGRVTRWLYVNYNGGERSEMLDEFRYDEKGNKTYSYHKAGDTVITGSYVYDEEGRLLEMKELDNTGAVKGWEQYTYDEKGNTLTENTSTDGILWTEVTYTYDEEGRLAAKNTTDGNNEWEKITYTYNADGTLKTEESVGAEGTEVVAYGYDEWGNRLTCLRQENQTATGRRETHTTLTRELHYYPNGVPEDITLWLSDEIW